jgi:glycosyltransferase involved in cell wall biosynthesis
MKNMAPLVSIVVCVKNGEKEINGCLTSILNQTIKDFEVIVVDDLSTDNTGKLIKAFRDPRIKYIKNSEWLGPLKSRNNGIKQTLGTYIFMTDSDCVLSKDWINEGLKSLSENNVGVEGRVVYVSESYEIVFSDYVMKNDTGGNYMTGNVAYRKDVLELVGGLNEEIRYFSDRALGLKVKKLGRIAFNRNMTVTHPNVKKTPKTLMRLAIRVEDRAFLFREFKDRGDGVIVGRILQPFNLAKIFFPPLIFASLFFTRLKREDYSLLPFTYVYAVLERLHFWKSCARNRVLLL